MIGCICGGVIEFALLGGSGIIVMIVAALTNWYNRYKCRKHNCQHNCK